MVKKESHTWPEIDRIEDEIEVYDQYIESLQKKCNLLKEEREMLVKIVEEMPIPTRGLEMVNSLDTLVDLNLWIDGYKAWHKRMTEHFADE